MNTSTPITLGAQTKPYEAAMWAHDTLGDVLQLSAVAIVDFVRTLEATVLEELPDNKNGHTLVVLVESMTIVKAASDARRTPSELLVSMQRDLSVRYMADW